jgi:hypothetical protein
MRHPKNGLSLCLRCPCNALSWDPGNNLLEAAERSQHHQKHSLTTTTAAAFQNPPA